MGHRTQVQQISRGRGARGQYYLTVPAELARALGLRKGEAAEWSLAGNGQATVRFERAPEQAGPAGEKSGTAAGRP